MSDWILAFFFIFCSHPALIQEEGDVSAFIAPEDADDKEYERRREHQRAKFHVSPEFVTKLLEKFMELAKRRVEAEKEVRSISTYRNKKLAGSFPPLVC